MGSDSLTPGKSLTGTRVLPAARLGAGSCSPTVPNGSQHLAFGECITLTLRRAYCKLGPVLTGLIRQELLVIYILQIREEIKRGYEAKAWLPWDLNEWADLLDNLVSEGVSEGVSE